MDRPPVKADKKYPPDDGDEPIDADDEWEEREQKGRIKKKRNDKKHAPAQGKE